MNEAPADAGAFFVLIEDREAGRLHRAFPRSAVSDLHPQDKTAAPEIIGIDLESHRLLRARPMLSVVDLPAM